MSEKQVERTLFYRRAAWHGGDNRNLEDCLRQVHRKLTDTKSRTFEYKTCEYHGLEVEDRKEYGMFFHVASYIPGQSASLVPKASTKKESSDTTTQEPPEGSDYMENDIFFAVSENNLVVLPNKCRETDASVYIKHFVGGISKDLDIDGVASLYALDTIEKEGVKSISFNSSLYKVSFDDWQEKTIKNTSLIEKIRNAKNYLLGLFEPDKSLEEIKELADVNVRVELTYNKRKNSAEIIGSFFKEKAIEIVNDDDSGFTIITQKGNTIGQNQIKVSRKEKFTARGQSIFTKQAFDVIQAYMQELKNNGSFDL